MQSFTSSDREELTDCSVNVIMSQIADYKSISIITTGEQDSHHECDLSIALSGLIAFSSVGFPLQIHAHVVEVCQCSSTTPLHLAFIKEARLSFKLRVFVLFFFEPIFSLSICYFV